jgi:hypothetical protein
MGVCCGCVCVCGCRCSLDGVVVVVNDAAVWTSWTLTSWTVVVPAPLLLRRLLGLGMKDETDPNDEKLPAPMERLFGDEWQLEHSGAMPFLSVSSSFAAAVVTRLAGEDVGVVGGPATASATATASASADTIVARDSADELRDDFNWPMPTTPTMSSGMGSIERDEISQQVTTATSALRGESTSRFLRKFFILGRLGTWTIYLSIYLSLCVSFWL